jgi:hypothetical protein
VYPLFRSSRIARGKECDESKQKILKYWVVFCCFKLISDYLIGILSYLDVSVRSLSGVHVVLVPFDFYVAEWLYDNIVYEFFSHNEKLLHGFFKQMRKILENTVYLWLDGIKDIVFAIIAGIIPRLPSALRTPLDFIGVTKFFEKSLDKYKAAEDKIKKEQEYLEYARKIE